MRNIIKVFIFMRQVVYVCSWYVAFIFNQVQATYIGMIICYNVGCCLATVTELAMKDLIHIKIY